MPKKSLVKHLDSIIEFERIPVPQQKQKGWGSFIGMYAGEHTAGTEFVIGPMFVAHGVAAGDLIFGLLVGNLLAVFSWAFLCAPIATKIRLTLYYMLEKICGTKLTSIYNVVNAEGGSINCKNLSARRKDCFYQLENLRIKPFYNNDERNSEWLNRKK